MNNPKIPLKPEQLKKKIVLPKSQVKNTEDILFQDTAKERLEDILDKKGPKQHVVIGGETGIGKKSLVEKVGAEYVKGKTGPKDIVAFLDFEENIARFLKFEPRKGEEFVKEHNQVIDSVLDILTSDKIQNLLKDENTVYSTELALKVNELVDNFNQNNSLYNFPFRFIFGSAMNQDGSTNNVAAIIPLDDKGEEARQVDQNQKDIGLVDAMYTVTENAEYLDKGIKHLIDSNKKMIEKLLSSTESIPKDPAKIQQIMQMQMQVLSLEHESRFYDYNEQKAIIHEEVIKYAKLKKNYEAEMKLLKPVLEKANQFSLKVEKYQERYNKWIAKIDESLEKNKTNVVKVQILNKRKESIQIKLDEMVKQLSSYEPAKEQFLHLIQTFNLNVSKLKAKKEELYSIDDEIIDSGKGFFARFAETLESKEMDVVKELVKQAYSLKDLSQKYLEKRKSELQCESFDKKLSNLEQRLNEQDIIKNLEPESLEKLKRFYKTLRQEFKIKNSELEGVLKGQSPYIFDYLNRFKVSLKLSGSENALAIVDKGVDVMASIGLTERDLRLPQKLESPHISLNLGKIFQTENGVYGVEIHAEQGFFLAKLFELAEQGSITLTDMQGIPKTEPLSLDTKIVALTEQGIARAFEMYESLNDKFRNVLYLEQIKEVNNETLSDFVQFLKMEQKKRDYLPLHNSALEELVNIAVRSVDNRGNFSVKCNFYSKLLSDLDQVARKNDNKQITKQHVLSTIDRIVNENQFRKAVFKNIKNGTSDCYVNEPAIPGSVNGLVVYSLGETYKDFGCISRFNVTVAPSLSGEIEFVELKTKQGGKYYDMSAKRVEAWFRQKLGPLVSYGRFSIASEQCYGGIDGDSASCALELAMLSELSGISISPHFALTGSMSEKGKVLPIGGVNEKIEGAIDTFKQFDPELSAGDYIITIPNSNVQDLMLREEYIKYVDSGKVKIYAVNHIDQVLEHGLMGNFEANQVYEKAKEKLKEFKQEIDDVKKLGKN